MLGNPRGKTPMREAVRSKIDTSGTLGLIAWPRILGSDARLDSSRRVALLGRSVSNLRRKLARETVRDPRSDLDAQASHHQHERLCRGRNRRRLSQCHRSTSPLSRCGLAGADVALG
eukprot:1072139-Rhodomonas_salina.1